MQSDILLNNSVARVTIIVQLSSYCRRFNESLARFRKMLIAAGLSASSSTFQASSGLDSIFFFFFPLDKFDRFYPWLSDRVRFHFFLPLSSTSRLSLSFFLFLRSFRSVTIRRFLSRDCGCIFLLVPLASCFCCAVFFAATRRLPRFSGRFESYLPRRKRSSRPFLPRSFVSYNFTIRISMFRIYAVPSSWIPTLFRFYIFLLYSATPLFGLLARFFRGCLLSFRKH